MADPFSIVASTISIVDVGVRVVQFLVEVKQGSDTIDDELDKLIGEINSLNAVSNLIRENFQKDITGGYDASSKEQEASAALWREAGNALRDCDRTLGELESIVQKIVGDGKSSTVDKLRRYFRKLSKQDDFVQLWQRLNKSHHLLQIMLTAINITYTRKSQATSSQSFAELSTSIQALGIQLQTQISSLEGKVDLTTFSTSETGTVLATAKSVKQLASLNIHFMIPQSVSSMYKGRKSALENLKRAFVDSGATNATKRFVIYGLGGSGKTQFCCKFAQEYRKEFWGVFYIDAGNAASAKASYADIAEKAKIEPNEASVKHWLSIQRRPWLLIVDNVDDRTGAIPPESYFPECEVGLVLLTTRNHALKTHGNFEPRFYEFKGLQEEESVDLLLTSAGQMQPFKVNAIQAAKDVCHALAFLPLALVQAGKAILAGKCKLESCLAFFEKALSAVQKAIEKRKGSRSQNADSLSNEFVFSTYEMISPAASEEAIELLNLFSFMHRQRFHFGILVQAVLNPQLERAAEKEALAKPRKSASQKSWSQTGRDLALRLHGLLARLGERRVLPKVLLAVEGLGRDEIEFRLRGALSELRSIALVDYVEEDDSYSVHPLIHRWVRERMLLKEQAVWCQAACNVLAQAVMLPPLGTRDSDAELRRHTLAHIEHARKQEERIQKIIRLNQRERKKPWPDVQRKPTGPEMRQLANFSLVYAEGGQWHKARDLMLIVDKFLYDNTGLGHPIAIRARLFLSASYAWLGEEDKSVSLQSELLEACKSSLGDRDVDTLTVVDQLGVSFWQQGKFTKAKEYGIKALTGLQDVQGADHADTLKAMSHLGRAVGKLAEFDEAVNLHERALEGLRRDESRRAHDQEVLEVMENLAMARYDRHRYGRPAANELKLAEELEAFVVKQREDKLGREHPLTLWAYCNFARIKAGLGALEEGEAMIRMRLPIAERNLGAAHIGTLFAKAYLGHILILENRLPEAQDMLEKVIHEHEKIRRDHPDKLVALAFLMQCYQRQGKLAEAQPMQTKVIEGARRLFGEGSPWEKHFLSYY